MFSFDATNIGLLSQTGLDSTCTCNKLAPAWVFVRINEYAYRLEDARAQAAYGMRGAVNKVLVINREIAAGRITVVLVDEVIGF